MEVFCLCIRTSNMITHGVTTLLGITMSEGAIVIHPIWEGAIGRLLLP